MERTGIEYKIRNRFKSYIKEEEFDTDAITDDIMNHEQGSNVFYHVADPIFTRYITDYIEEMNSM